MVVDRGEVFEGTFLTGAVRYGVDVRFVPPGAHWQLGSAGSGNCARRRVFEKVIDTTLPIDPARVDLAVIATRRAVNRSVSRADHTAYAAGFGRVPTLPTELLADTTSAD